MNTDNLSSFCRAYLACALWSSTDELTPSGGNPLDDNYGLDDFAPESIDKAIAVCLAFQLANVQDLILAEMTDERAGHCLWLNRNGHGSGFWDEYRRDDSPQYLACQRLSDASKAIGSSDAYIGDDGKIYLS
jgi:hypothetical protein